MKRTISDRRPSINPADSQPYLDLGYVPCREAWGPRPKVQSRPVQRPRVLDDIRLGYLQVRR